MFSDTQKSLRTLVVDDNSDTRDFVGTVLQLAGCDVRLAFDGDQALVEAHRFQPDIVFLDVDIPEQDGWLVCAKLKLVAPSPTVILMTGLDRSDLFAFAEVVKADDVLKKPFSADDVIRSLPQVTV